MDDLNASEAELLGIVLVTHGNFGQALIEAAETVLGPQEKCLAVGVDVTQGVDATMETIRSALLSVQSECGALALTDLFGGSPTTMSLSLMKSENIEVITGVNLPMLVAALQARCQPIDEAAQKAKEAGRQGIKVAGAMLRKGKKRRS